MVTPAAKREAVARLQTDHEVSQRRACKVLQVDRSSVRYRARRADDAPDRERYLRWSPTSITSSKPAAKIAKDPNPGPGKKAQGRRVDFMVVDGETGRAKDSVEVTSVPAVTSSAKLAQGRREVRIRGSGGTFIKTPGYSGKVYDFKLTNTRVEGRP